MGKEGDGWVDVYGAGYDETVVNPTYVVVDTNQTTNWNNSDEEGDSFYGQDAQYEKNAPNYTNNGDDTVTDNNTGLMWQKSPDTKGDGSILADDKYSYDEAVANAALCTNRWTYRLALADNQGTILTHAVQW